MFSGACLAAGPFARALGSPEAANLVRVVSIVILIDGISGAHFAVLVRTFRNDRLAVAELTGFLIGTPVTVALALLNAGPWSIVLGHVVGACAVGSMVIRSTPIRIRPAFDRPTARTLVSFGAPLRGERRGRSGRAQRRLRRGGTQPRRRRARHLPARVQPLELADEPRQHGRGARVSFAGLSRLVEDRDRLASAFPRSIGVAISVLMPLVILLAILAPELIPVVYGTRWQSAVTPLRFLVVLGGLRILIDLLIDLAIADGRPRVALTVRTAWLAAIVPALAIGAELDGLRGVGIAHALVAAGLIVPWLLIDARRSGIPTLALARQATRPVAGGAVARRGDAAAPAIRRRQPCPTPDRRRQRRTYLPGRALAPQPAGHMGGQASAASEG